jgi:phosphopantothenoylcysteine decarboxylase / phosphopantothenate---cysteine ligase
MLTGKKIILGITGSIAAYKAAILTRLLVKAGAEVKVVMTESACEFITPLTLSTLSQHPVIIAFKKADDGTWNNHVELALWADLMIIAPATANVLAQLGNGICENVLAAVYLSARCPVFFAPAMDLEMFVHDTTYKNIKKLRARGNYIIDAGTGFLASGLEGKGRMAEPEEIVEELSVFFSRQNQFHGKKVLVTAGPTYEQIDPVRFIGNNSTGKMGFAIASEFQRQGAEVMVISGPVKETYDGNQVKVISAEEMYQAAIANFGSVDIAVMAAAVADYTPKIRAIQKIKKDGDELTLELVKTKDIAYELGRVKKAGQFLAGFALETENELENARKKLLKKNLDLIILNSLNDAGAGFQSDTNKITILDKSNNTRSFELKSKREVAVDILQAISDQINA